VFSPPKAPLYIVGRGAPYPLPKEALGRRPGRKRAAAARVCGAESASKTLTLAGLGQGSRAPPIFLFLRDGFLLVNWPIR
jgi:hypothetical protein